VSAAQEALLNRAEVTVYQPCDCAVCRNPRSRWFMCPSISKRWVETYDAPACDARPLKAAIEEIRALHPGCDLVYLD
jgi:hypothetical protein